VELQATLKQAQGFLQVLAGDPPAPASTEGSSSSTSSSVFSMFASAFKSSSTSAASSGVVTLAELVFSISGEVPEEGSAVTITVDVTAEGEVSVEVLADGASLAAVTVPAKSQ
jgi:uncharacterized protein YaiE (UPF0345 family)